MARHALLTLLSLVSVVTAIEHGGRAPAWMFKRQATSSSATCITAPPSTSSTTYTSGIHEAGTVIIYSPYYSSCPTQTTNVFTTSSTSSNPSSFTTSIASSTSSTSAKISTSTSVSASTIQSSTSTTSSALGPTSSAAGTFGCNSTAYFVQTTSNIPKFYNINLKTGGTFIVNNNLGNGRYINVNGMGFNPLDNFLYAVATISTGNYAVVKINVNGTFTEILDFTASSTPGSVGDVAANGHFYFSGAGLNWYEVDLAPGSSTYGKLLNNGTSTLTGYGVFDWSYLPGQGNYMYAVSASTGSSPHLGLLRWSLDTHVWSVVQDYPSIAAANSFIASWSAYNGTIWGYAATSGQITQIDPGKTPYNVSTGLTGINNGDGARCYYTS